jgi:hypothetical protein
MCAFFKNIYSNHCNRKKFVFFFLSLARREREREREREKLEQRGICMYISEESLIINCKNNLLTKNKNNNEYACVLNKNNLLTKNKNNNECACVLNKNKMREKITDEEGLTGRRCFFCETPCFDARLP